MIRYLFINQSPVDQPILNGIFTKIYFSNFWIFFSRYIICKGLRGDTRDIVRAYMYEINGMLNKFGVDSEPNDVQSIVPMNILKENEKFYEYIRNSNNQ